MNADAQPGRSANRAGTVGLDDTAAHEFANEVIARHVALGAALEIHCQSATGHGDVTLWMPRSALAANHVGTVYAGASYVLAELGAGISLGLLGHPDLVPVLVGSEASYLRPAVGDLVCSGSPALTCVQLRAALRTEPRLATTFAISCRDGDRVCVEATFRYRWIAAPS